MHQPLLYMTLAQIVLERPERCERMRALGLDCCCNGRRPLSVACAAAGLQAVDVAKELAAIDPRPGGTASVLREIAGHIDQVHHALVRREMPRLVARARELARQRPDNARIAKLADELDALSVELARHLDGEERTVFQFVASMPDSGCSRDEMARQVHGMIVEHDESGHALERMRMLTTDYAPSGDAEQDELLAMLRSFDEDLHRHIFEENNLLFPMALRAAGARR